MNKRKYQKTIKEMQEDELELNEKTKKEIDEARRQVKKGNVYTQEEVRNMLGFDKKKAK